MGEVESEVREVKMKMVGWQEQREGGCGRTDELTLATGRRLRVEKKKGMGRASSSSATNGQQRVRPGSKG